MNIYIIWRQDFDIDGHRDDKMTDCVFFSEEKANDYCDEQNKTCGKNWRGQKYLCYPELIQTMDVFSLPAQSEV